MKISSPNLTALLFISLSIGAGAVNGLSLTALEGARPFALVLQLGFVAVACYYVREVFRQRPSR